MKYRRILLQNAEQGEMIRFLRYRRTLSGANRKPDRAAASWKVLPEHPARYPLAERDTGPRAYTPHFAVPVTV